MSASRRKELPAHSRGQCTPECTARPASDASYNKYYNNKGRRAIFGTGRKEKGGGGE